MLGSILAYAHFFFFFTFLSKFFSKFCASPVEIDSALRLRMGNCHAAKGVAEETVEQVTKGFAERLAERIGERGLVTGSKNLSTAVTSGFESRGVSIERGLLTGKFQCLFLDFSFGGESV